MATYIDLLGRVCRKGVCSWQVSNLNGITLVVKRSTLCIHRNTAIVSHVLTTTTERIKERCLTRVRVTYQTDSNMVMRAIKSLRHNILAIYECWVFRQDKPTRLLACHHHNHLSLLTTQRDIVAHDMILDRVFERGIEDHCHLLAAHKSHLHNTTTKTTIAKNLDHGSRLSCFQIA